MAGVPKDPFSLDLRGKVWRVRFSRDGERLAVSTGETDKGKAREKAREIYAQAGKARPQRSGVATIDAVSEWKAALPTIVSALTAAEYGFVGDKFPGRWPRLSDIDPPTIGQWTQDRLKEATRETVRKNRAALGNFLRFCVERRWMAELVPLPPIGKSMGTRVLPDKHRVPIPPDDVEKLLKAMPAELRRFYTFLWETAWRPVTVCQLHAKYHAPTLGPRGKDSGLGIWVNPEIEKSRNATRGKKGKKAWVPLSKRAIKMVEEGGAEGPIFGVDERRPEKLKSYAMQVLGREVTEYDFKHSRITSWFRDGKDPLGISYATGVALDTLIKHYAHPGEEAARTLF